MKPAHTGPDQNYQDPAYASSLELPVSATASLSNADKPKHLSLFHYNGTALLITGAIIALIALLGMGTLIFSGFHGYQQSDQTNYGVPDNYGVSDLALGGAKANKQLGAGGVDHLAINGQLRVSDTLVLAPTERPGAPRLGQLYLSKDNNKLYFYNGTAFEALGAGNQAGDSSAGSTGVTSLQGQAGALNLKSGGGLSINGLTIANTGVTAVNGTPGQIGVSRSNGNVTFSLPQNIDEAASPGFASLRLSNALGVAYGGTGVSGFDAGSVLVGNGTGAVTSSAPGTSGWCLLSNGPAVIPTFQVCPAATGTGNVSSGASQTSGRLVMWDNAANRITDSLLNQSGSTITLSGSLGVSGSVTAGNFNGNGSGLTSVDAATLGGQGSGFYRSADNINAGTLSVARGGTAAGTAAGARTNLGAAASGANSDITSLSVLTSITPSSALTVGATGQNLTLQGNAGTTWSATSGGFITTVGFSGTPGASVVYNFDSAAASGTYNICTTAGNCAGQGGGVSSNGGTNGRIAKFTGSQAIADSLLSESGSTVTVNGILSVTGSNSLSLGVSGSNQGAILFKNNTNANVLTLQSGATSGNFTLILPTSDGSSGQCLQTNGLGALSFVNCLSGSGANGGVTQLNGFTGAVTVSGAANQINVSNSGNTISLSAPQDIAPTSSPTFSNLTLLGTSGLNVGSGSVLGKIALGDGNSVFTTTLQPSNLTAARILTIPNAGGTLAVSASGNIALSAAGNISFSGVLPITNGGTGASTAAGARTGLSAASSGVNADITTLSALTAITPTSSLTIGSTNQNLTLQGNAGTTLSAGAGGFTTTLGFAAPTANQVINLPSASGTVCLDSGNCLGGTSGAANAQLSNLNSVAINTALLPQSFGSIDLGSSTKPFRGLYLSNALANFAFHITGATTSADKTLNLPNFTGASADICVSTGNCAGSGGGVTASGASANTIALFTGSQSITNSILTQDGGATTLTVGGKLTTTGKLTVDGSVSAGITCGATPTVCLNGSDILNGTVPDARLSVNVTLQGNLFNGTNQLVKTNGSGQLPAISGVNLTNLNASNIASGTLADARLSSNVALLNASQTFTGTLTVASLVLNNNLTLNGHLITGGTTPTTAVNANAGSGATCVLSGSDTAGTVTITTGTGTVNAGTLCTITFNSSYGAAPRVVLGAKGAAAAALNPYSDNTTTTTFDIGTGTAGAVSTVYKMEYIIAQ